MFNSCLAIKKGASIDGQFRYNLTREWDAGLYTMTVVMLNPSTADAAVDDPTIRRLYRFAVREGFGGINVVNLFALRSPSPKDLKACSDPHGLNSHYLELTFEMATTILCAWGSESDAIVKREAEAMRSRIGSLKLSMPSIDIRCLGLTADGVSPRHPLYVKGDQPMIPYSVRKG